MGGLCCRLPSALRRGSISWAATMASRCSASVLATECKAKHGEVHRLLLDFIQCVIPTHRCNKLGESCMSFTTIQLPHIYPASRSIYHACRGGRVLQGASQHGVAGGRRNLGGRRWAGAARVERGVAGPGVLETNVGWQKEEKLCSGSPPLVLFPCLGWTAWLDCLRRAGQTVLGWVRPVTGHWSRFKGEARLRWRPR